jgi:hypothetical protein
VAFAECGIRENLAEYYGQKSATARLEGVGGEAGQTPIFFIQTRNRGLKTAYRQGRMMQDWTVNMTVALTL